MYFQMKRLVFLEFVDETRVFLNRYINEIRLNPDEFTIITFHPSVKSYLLKHDITSTDSFHFCPSKSHQNLLVVLDEYTEQVRSECRLRDSFGVEESYVENLLWFLRGILSHWLYRVEVIFNAIDYYKPEVIISIGSRKPNVVKSPQIEFEERYITNIVSQICSKKDIEMINLSFTIPYNYKKQFLQSLKDFVINVVSSVVRNCISPKPNLIIAPGHEYGMGDLLRAVRKEMGEGYHFAALNTSIEKTPYVVIKNIFGSAGDYYLFPWASKGITFLSQTFINKRNHFRKRLFSLFDQWRYLGISPSECLKQKYRFALEPELIDKTYCQAANLNKFLNRWKPIFVLSSHSRCMSAVLGELCKVKQIPSLIVPHGSFTPIFNEYAKKEWKEVALGLISTPYRYVAIQTPLAEKFLLNMPYRSEPVITGPIIFGRKIDKLSENIKKLKKQYAPEGEKIILHAGTPKNRKGQRLLIFETIDEYVDGIISLIKAVDTLKNVHMIIRFRPVDGLGVEELSNLLPKSDSYSIASDGALADYLSIADLLVSFSSTSIEEALQNRIPVLLYGGYGRYLHVPSTVVEAIKPCPPSAVYHVKKNEDLDDAINKILQLDLCSDHYNYLFDPFIYMNEQKVSISKLIKQAGVSSAMVAKKDGH